MNTFSVVSRVLVVTAVVFVGSVSAGDNTNLKGKTFSEYYKSVNKNIRYNTCYNLGSIATAIIAEKWFKEDEFVKKAFADGIGRTVDHIWNKLDQDKDIDLWILAQEGALVVADCGIRAGEDYLSDKAGINLKSVENTCDYLPEMYGARDAVVKPVAQACAKLVTHPQFIIVGVVNYLYPCWSN